MPTEDRRVGKLLPNPVTPLTTVCYTIQIPNAVQYRAAFLGQLDILGSASTWDHARGDNECLPCEEAAQLWRNALYGATWSDECGGQPMACIDVAECFETDAAFRTSVINALMSDPEFTQDIRQSLGGGGSPSSSGDLAAGTNPTCNLDILWAECLAIVQNTNAAVTDVLEKIEAATNAVELIDAASEIPFVGWAKEAIGGQAALDLIQYYQEAVQEQYAAQYTTTAGGVQDQLACALFCAAKDDCELTVARIFAVFKGRLEEYITVPSLTTLGDLIDFAAGMSQDNTIVVDAAFFVAWAGVALGSYLFGEVFDVSMEMIIKLAADDPSSDWETLCEDCPPDVPVIIWAPDGKPGGSLEVTSNNPITITLTAAQGNDTYYRAAIQFNNTGHCYKWLSQSNTGTMTAGYTRRYNCGLDPATNGYNITNTVAQPIMGNCYSAVLYGSLAAFTVTITVEEC